MHPIFGPISTERLRLRQYQQGDDVQRIFSLISDPEVMRYYPSVYDVETAQKWLDAFIASYEKRGYSMLAVERQSDGDFVGQVGLLHWDDVDSREDVEVAYMLRPSHWGRGYAAEAARASRDWAFANLPVDRVVSFISVVNQPSIAVAERNDMERLKRLEENRFGVPMYVYGIMRDAWETARS